MISAFKRVEPNRDRMACIILRGRRCNIFVLNVYSRPDDKIDVEDSFYKEVERVFDKFLKHHMKISLGDFNAKVGREDFLNR
jgi:hypothetical protein